MQDVTLDPLGDFECPDCGMSLDAREAEAFSDFACPHCGNTGTVPGSFGSFHLVRKLGESITSVLFDAYDPKLGRHVSLKILNVILSKNSALVEAFKKEALAAASLNSLFVLKVYEFGVHNRQPYMVMEHIEGRFLHEVLEEGPMEQREAIDVTLGIVQGLRDMHEVGIVHGDVMPRNILVHTDGSPRISDFGLARFDGEEGGPLQSWSSPYYMPPERIRQEPEDFRGDFYSLGTTLYFMLTGHLPYFDLDEDRVLEQKVNEPAPDPRYMVPALHEAVSELTGYLLHRNPEDRPSSFSELLELLQDVTEFLPRQDRPRQSTTESTLLAKPLRRKSRREPVIWFLFFSLAGILAAMVLAVLTRPESPEISDPAPTPVPAATPTPPPTPSPSPTLVQTPVKPTPVPPPTPVPSPPPLSLSQISEGQMFLQPSGTPGSAVSEWRSGEDILFQQADPEYQPRLVNPPGKSPLALSFGGAYLASSLTPHWEEAFTLVLMIQEEEARNTGTRRLVIGVRPDTEGKTPFAVFTEPALSGGYRFITDRGSASLTLPLQLRDQPVLLAFRRTPGQQEAFVAGRRNVLPDLPESGGEPRTGAVPSLQLGGTSDSALDFHGWIGDILLTDRALTDEELSVVFQSFCSRYRKPE